MRVSKFGYAGAILASIGIVGPGPAYGATAIKCEGSIYGSPSSFTMPYEQQGHTFIIDDVAGTITRWVARVGQAPVCQLVEPCMVQVGEEIIHASAKNGGAEFSLTISRTSGKISEVYTIVTGATLQSAQLQGRCDRIDMPSLEGKPRKF